MSTENAQAPLSEAPVSETPQTTSDVASTSEATSQTADSSSSSSESWLDRLDNVFGEENVEEPTSEEAKETEKSDEKSESADDKTESSSEETSEETEPTNMSVEARRAFKEYRVKNRELSKQLETTKAELQKLKESPSEKPADTEQVQKLAEENKVLKSKLEEVSTELSTISVETTPEYKEQVIRPLVDTLRSAGALSEKYSVSKRLLERAIEESAEKGTPSDELTDVATSMNTFDQQELHLLVRGMRNIMERKAWYRDNHKEFVSQKQAEAKQAYETTVAEQRKAVLSASEDVWKKLSELGPIKNMPESDRTKAYEMARSAVATLGDASNDVKSYSSFAAALLPGVLRQVKEANAKVKELQTSLAKYTKSKPKAGAGTSDGGVPAAPEGLSFLDAIEAGIGS
jgi:hypothetical protein